MREAFKLLDRVPSERFKGCDNVGMQYPPPLLEEAAVGHLLGEGVLEGVDQLGEQARLVQELGVLEMREAQAEASSGNSATAWRRVRGTSVPMTAAVWSRRFSSGASGRGAPPGPPAR